MVKLPLQSGNDFDLIFAGHEVSVERGLHQGREQFVAQQLVRPFHDLNVRAKRRHNVKLISRQCNNDIELCENPLCGTTHSKLEKYKSLYRTLSNSFARGVFYNL